MITVAILVVLKGAALDVYRRLMDAVDPALVDLAEASLRAVPGVIAVEEPRLRWIGHRVRAETGITVDAGLGIVAAHDIATTAKHTLLHEVPKLVAATVHVSPRDSTGHDHHAVLAHHRAAPSTPARIARLGVKCAARLEALVVDGTGLELLAELKSDPGKVGLETLPREIDKLAALRELGLTRGLVADASEKLVDAWRARAARSYRRICERRGGRCG